MIFAFLVFALRQFDDTAFAWRARWWRRRSGPKEVLANFFVGLVVADGPPGRGSG
jgi:hypothetical protein